MRRPAASTLAGTRPAAMSLALALFLAGTGMFGPSAFAQAPAAAPAEDDPFSLEAFDSGVQAAIESDQAAGVESIVGGTLVPSVTATSSENFGGYAASGSLSGKLLAKVSLPDKGQFFASVGISQVFLQGRGGDLPALKLAATPLYSPTLTLTELHYSFDIGKTLFVRFGNQLVAWGPSKIWSVVDFINLQKADAFAGVDLRVGKPGLRLHLPLPSSNLFAFADFSGTVAKVDNSTKPWLVRELLDSSNLGLRYDLSAFGFEMGLTGYAGMGVQGRGGLDFSGRLLGFTVYGEAAFLPAYDAYDFSWSASAGLERKVGDQRKVTLSGEFFYNSAGADDESGYPAAWTDLSFQPNYVGKYYAYAGLTWDDLFSDDLSTSLSALANLSDMSASLRLTESADIPGLPPFSVILGWTGGGPNKAYTYYADNNAFSLTLQSRIEF